MVSESQKSKRIAKNTFLLYIRMLILMVISLYTSRVILNSLGVVDYGIYNVVGGVVTMFTMISGSLSTAISRYLTFSLGKEDHGKLSLIFSTSVNIQIILSLIILVVAETIGLWFLNYKMTIPSDRWIAANWVYQFSILTFIINLISVPYNAAIIAHEKMSAFAYISIVEAMGKLLIAWLISVDLVDRLIFYALMCAVLSIIVRAIYSIYCKRHFEETSYKFIFDKDLLKEMFGFAGWNFLGSSAMVLREHGGNLLINIFFGPTVNAARAIATKINSTVQSFVTNFMMALNPQITKSYASGNYPYMFKLMFQGTRLSFYMMLFLSLPIMLNIEFILKIWLKLVPDHATSFACLILILAMSDILSGTLITAFLATGKVKRYQIVVGTLQLLNLPITYVCYRIWKVPEIVVGVSILISNIAVFVRLVMLKELMPIKVKDYLVKVYLRVLLVAFLSALLPYFISVRLEVGLTRLALTTLLSTLLTSLVVYYIGCSKDERKLIVSKISSLLVKIKR